MISEEFVVDDPLGLFVPQGRYGDFAGVMRITRAIGLVQIVKAIDLVRRTIGKRGIVLERPAFLAQARYSNRYADGAGKFLQSQIDLRAMRPRAGIGHVEVIAPGFGFEAGRAVGGDPVAENTVDPLEITGAASFLRQILVAPFAVDQNTHQAASPRTSAAAWRIAAIFVR